jgi:ferric-dicitrate binding protein FerR (iron transport regulator)
MAAENNEHAAVERDVALFERYLARECTPHEAVHVEELIRRDASRERLMRELTALKTASRLVSEDWQVDGLWQEMRAQIGTPVSGGNSAPPASPGMLRRWAWPVGRAAALVAISVGATLGWRALSSRHGDAVATARVRAYTTQPGQQAVIQLLDGTKVTLAVSSTLLVPREFGRASRDVELNGEAYFDVAHDSVVPFRVHAGAVVSRVVGTRFGVRAYPGESRVEVVVTAGRVRVERDSSALRDDAPRTELGPGELARVSRDGEIRVERNVDVARYLSWRTGRLTFVDTPVPEILAELERWHGVRFTLADPSLASRVLTTTLEPGALQTTLAVLEAGLDVRAVQSDSGVRLERREQSEANAK